MSTNRVTRRFKSFHTCNILIFFKKSICQKEFFI